MFIGCIRYNQTLFVPAGAGQELICGVHVLPSPDRPDFRVSRIGKVLQVMLQEGVQPHLCPVFALEYMGAGVIECIGSMGSKQHTHAAGIFDLGCLRTDVLKFP